MIEINKGDKFFIENLSTVGNRTVDRSGVYEVVRKAGFNIYFLSFSGEDLRLSTNDLLQLINNGRAIKK